MKKSVRILAVALIALFLVAPLAFAEEKEATVLVIDEQQGVYTVKDKDGKEYKITQDLVGEIDLDTGDAIIMEVEGAKPVKVKHKKK